MAFQSLIPFTSNRETSERGYSSPMLQLHREMNRMFDDMFRGIAPNAPSNENTLIPSMDVSQEEGQLKGRLAGCFIRQSGDRGVGRKCPDHYR